MLDNGKKNLYLFRFSSALSEIRQSQSHRFPKEEEGAYFPGRYLHWQVLPSQWRRMRTQGDVSPLHKWFKTDNWWMRQCLPSNKLQDEYHIKTHWRVILIGSRGAGMFNHSDSLLSSSWHAHVQGKKWWYVCSGGQGVRQTCYEEVLSEGDVLFYPKHYYHETQNLADPLTMTITGTVVNAYNYEELAGQLHKECSRGHLGFDLSGPLCDALQDCYALWHKKFSDGNGAAAEEVWPSWQKSASDRILAIRNSELSRGNNYDGRNPISG